MRGLPFAILVLLSGCVDAAPHAAAPPSPTVAGPASYEPGMGAIDGSVVDAELRPIVDAQILLSPGDRTTRTDGTGRFTFANVPPGRHTIFASALGAEATAKALDVRPDEVTQVQILLQLLEVAEPYTVTLQEKGIAGCFLAYRVPGSANGNVYCGHAHTAASRNEHLIHWPPIQPMRHWMGSVFEMSWKSTQLAGQAMQGKLYIAYESRSCGGMENLVFLEGTSPLRGVADSNTTTHFIESAQKECPKVCNLDSCALMSWVGGVPHVLGPTAPADAGLLLEQTFEQYHTAFFWDEAPPEYSALADA